MGQLRHLYNASDEISGEWRSMRGDIRAGDERERKDRQAARLAPTLRKRATNSYPPRASATVNRDVRSGTDYWQTPCERMHLTGGFRRAPVRSLSPRSPSKKTQSSLR